MVGACCVVLDADVLGVAAVVLWVWCLDSVKRLETVGRLCVFTVGFSWGTAIARPLLWLILVRSGSCYVNVSAPTSGAMRNRKQRTMFPQNLTKSLATLYVRIDVYIYLMTPRLWHLMHQLQEAVTGQLIAIQHPMYAPMTDRIPRLYEALVIVTGAPTTAQMVTLVVIVIIQTVCVSLTLRTRPQHAIISHQRL